jgi:hypothetical protein
MSEMFTDCPLENQLEKQPKFKNIKDEKIK